MIKSLHKLLVASNQEDYRALVELFEITGLSRGEVWSGKRSRGTKLLAPAGGVEIGWGSGFPAADLVLECDSADTLYEALRRQGAVIIDEIADTEWGARLFLVEMPAQAGRLAIFSYKEIPQGRSGATLDARGLRFGIVVSRFNSFITERLLAGALEGLVRVGAETRDIQITHVPGAFEIPAAARALAKTRRYDAVICIGCLLRGDTLHYEVIANEVVRGIGESGQATGVPHILGVLTCDTLEQAIDRAGVKSGNKGFEAALAAVEMARMKKAGGEGWSRPRRGSGNRSKAGKKKVRRRR